MRWAVGMTPLFIPCRFDHLEVVRLLVEKEVDMDKANMHGETPLFIACREGHRDIVQLLVEKGPT